MTNIFEVLEKAKRTRTLSPKQRLAAQDRERASFEAENPIQNKLPRNESVIPKTTKPKTTKPKTAKPKTKKPKTTKPKTTKPKTDKSKLKTPKGAVGSKVGETYAQSADRVATSVRARAGGAGRVRAGSAMGRSTNRHTANRKQKKIKIKSIDEIQGFLQGMNHVIKREEGFKTRVTGTNLDTKMRQQKQEGKIRDKPKEVKTGNNFNLQTRIGDAAEKSVCPLIKTELNGAFNNLLDQYQYKHKDYFEDKFNEAEGKGKKPKITTDSRRGARGTDHRVKDPAIGSTRQDQAVMQS